MILAGQAEITELLGLRDCRFERAPYEQLPHMQRSGLVEHPGSRVIVHRLTKDGFELPTGGVELTVLNRGQQIGRYVLDSSPGVGVSFEQRVVAVALADQVRCSAGALTLPSRMP